MENRPDADFMGPVSRIDIIARYRILSTQNEGGLARLPIRHPRGALDGRLTDGCCGNFWTLGGWASKQVPITSGKDH